MTTTNGQYYDAIVMGAGVAGITSRPSVYRSSANASPGTVQTREGRAQHAARSARGI